MLRPRGGCILLSRSVTISAHPRHGRAYRQTHLRDAVARDQQRDQQITQDPKQHQTGPKVTVGIIQADRRVVFWFLIRGQRPLDCGLELAVDIRLRFIDFFDEVALAAVGLLRLRRGQGVRLIGSLRTPRHIVPVAKRIYHENIDRGGHAQEVRPGTGQDVPGVHIKDAGDYVDAISRHQSNQDNPSTTGAEEGGEEVADALVEIKVHHATHERIGDQVERQDQHVELHQRKVKERQGVGDFSSVSVSSFSSARGFKNLPFWSISQSQHKLDHQDQKVTVLDKKVDNGRGVVAEWPRLVLVIRAGCPDKVHDD